MKFDSAPSWTGPSVSISASGRSGRRLAQAGDQLVDSRWRPGRRLPDGPRPGANVGVGDDQDRLADVIEQDHPVIQGERQVG